jgi:hypothetical protein
MGLAGTNAAGRQLFATNRDNVETSWNGTGRGQNAGNFVVAAKEGLSARTPS